MFISIKFTETNIDKMNKPHQKVIGSKFMFKMSTIHTKTCTETTIRHCTSLPRWWSGPALAAFTPSADVLSTPLHYGSANGRPSLNAYPRRCSPPISSIWVATSLGWTLAFLSVAMWQCHVHDVISLTSALRHQVSAVRDA